ncbi:hypothetical protein BSZ32_04095 [Rubritalea profundi]|uniref:Uncharacterized protein n=2 Tax=Rubritalea profundi TaxID=1658618 RepID=A0A2S7U043_9BACT|nr:hypothetical protein BSZ32_04095 [Rubritalea profundi]
MAIFQMKRGKLRSMSFASLVWKLFRLLITGALEVIKGLGEEMIQDLTGAAGHVAEEFLNDAFHMTDKHIESLQTAENLGQTP